MSNLALIDGNYLVNRVVHKHLHLSDSAGHPTGGIYGFLRSFWGLKELGYPIVVFDGGKSALRKKIFPDYKKRDKKDEDVQKVLDYTFRELITLLLRMGIVSLRIPGVEADDILYILTKIFSELHTYDDIYAISDDEDFLQFLKISNAHVYQPMKDVYWDRKKFEEKWGFTPEYFTLWKSMIGDTSDKIPGIHNLGIRSNKELRNKFLVASFVIKQLKEPSLAGLWDWINLEESYDIGGKKIYENFALVKRNYFLIDLDQADVAESKILEAYNIAKREAKLDLEYVVGKIRELEIDNIPLAGYLQYLANKENV